MEALEELRDKIDQVDEQLLELLGQRMELVKQVGVVKKEYDLAIHDENREQNILARLTEKAQRLAIPKEIVYTLWQSLFAAAKEVEEKQ